MKQKASEMEGLYKMDLEKVLCVDSVGNDPSHLQINIDKLHAKHIKLCIIRHGVKQRSESLTNDYVVFYESFLDDLRAKFAMYNNQNIDDDFLADYLNVYSALHYGKGEVEYLLRVIKDIEQENQRRKKSNEEYRLANQELTNIYADLENLYIRTSQDIYNLTHVREKIQYNEELMRYLLQCKKDNQITNLAADSVRMNNSANSSSSSNNDSVLYNSRSDSLNSTGMFPRYSRYFILIWIAIF